jgi:hypothetical protein
MGLTRDQEREIFDLHLEGDTEGCIETVFAYQPLFTRDEAVDLYEDIVKRFTSRPFGEEWP